MFTTQVLVCVCVQKKMSNNADCVCVLGVDYWHKCNLIESKERERERLSFILSQATTNGHSKKVTNWLKACKQRLFCAVELRTEDEV